MTVYALGDRRPELPADGDVWVAPGAHVMGSVRLGPGVSIWFGAVLRGDKEWLSVGAGSNIQDGTVCHADPGVPLVVGENVTVGHNAIIHGCTIGDGSLIGMGATVLNGAKIGKGCLIGANALVTEGKEIPDGWMAVGAPAKPVRELTEAEKAGLLDSARRYRENGRHFRETLTEL